MFNLLHSKKALIVGCLSLVVVTAIVIFSVKQNALKEKVYAQQKLEANNQKTVLMLAMDLQEALDQMGYIEALEGKERYGVIKAWEGVNKAKKQKAWFLLEDIRDFINKCNDCDYILEAAKKLERALSTIIKAYESVEDRDTGNVYDFNELGLLSYELRESVISDILSRTFLRNIQDNSINEIIDRYWEIKSRPYFYRLEICNAVPKDFHSFNRYKTECEELRDEAEIMTLLYDEENSLWLYAFSDGLTDICNFELINRYGVSLYNRKNGQECSYTLRKAKLTRLEAQQFLANE